MRRWQRLVGATVVVTGGWTLGDSLARAQQPTPPQPTPSPAASPTPRPARPIAISVDRVATQVLRAHEDPCEKANREGVPCFPVTVEQEGPTFSVKDAIRNYRPDGKPAPGPPTAADMHQQMGNAVSGPSFDPVCTVKSLIRQVRGGASTLYLYRTWNGPVERPLLTDHELDPKTYAAVPAFRYELLGEFKGECEAIAAWRAALRKAAAPPPE